MADSDRVVFPDEVEEIKAKAKVESGDTNTVEEPPAEQVVVDVKNRNMIVVPSNCPDGYQMGADGVCREVF